MQYYYSSHIRNLEDEAYLQKQKISAELHQSALTQRHLASSRARSNRSRRQQDQETAAYLQRSRLEAELSAARAKAESSMNRSRLEAAFQIRKQNQKVFQQLSQMDLHHQAIIRRAVQQEQQAHRHFLQSSNEVQAKLAYEDRLLQLQREEAIALQSERSYRDALLRRPYFW